ncbi:helix-turn-helix domain-containing protein [Pseudomonas reactans]|uniref:helix-turn-helix domain-containing protein n=1 Tax=Pseudomonas reactans TaxID=117680 RepID=UPI0015BBF596|nr:helix-turn-helix domain-containing protein [Pseudomonas reactans]NWD84676.1 helix-turn-helix domain-containing protein [Pseudomonas reactans]
MISNHLSLVKALRPKSNELADQIAEFVAAGGKIEVAEPYHYKPKPITYSNQMPPTPKPFVRREVEANPLPLDKTDIRSQDRLKLAEQIRQLGVTLTQTEVAAELGVSRRLIYNYAARYDITFKPPTRGGARNLVRKEVDEARDAKLAERIRAFLELGITRRQCCGKLAIGNKAFERIITAHGIDYPKARQGSRSCAA